MRPRLVLILVLLVAAPLAGLSWLVFELARGERAAAQREYEAVLLLRLRDVAGRLDAVMATRERELGELLAQPGDDAETLRARARKAPHVRQLFVRAADGRLSYPALDGELSASEREFLMRTRQLWLARDLFTRPPESGGKQATATHGWYVYYAENDMGLMYWQRDGKGVVRGAELERVRLLADLVAELPAQDAAFVDGAIALTDARGDVVYRWGGYAPPAGEAPRAHLALAAPLQAWSLAHYVAPAALAAAESRGDLALRLFFAAAALLLVFLAAYFYREQAREMRAARLRVSFVNQVSHELKTPLTNIRMYAELLHQDLEDESGPASRHVAVIVAESQRLSRLIGNVLSFARSERQTLEVKPRPGSVDAVVRDVVEQFSPLLREKGVEVALDLQAPKTVTVDADALSQVLGNLVSNVDKYAAGGKQLAISSRQSQGASVLEVADQGPGIPQSQAERVFEPFFRLDDRVTEGVSGTGLGLTLARQLARLHGGDLRLMPAPKGACFRLTLSTPEVPT